MKITFAFVVLSAFFLAGCGDSSKSSTQAGGNPVTAPADYVAASVKAEQSMIKTIDTTSLNENVQLFNAQEGRYPKDLDELVTKKYIGKLPAAPAGMKLAYDATSGKVTVVKQ